MFWSKCPNQVLSIIYDSSIEETQIHIEYIIVFKIKMPN